MDKKTQIKPRKAVKILFFLLIFILLLFLYARYINTKGLIIKESAIIDEELDSHYNGLKVVQFSDIHYGRTTSKDDLNMIVEEINSLHPDIIVFTGDLFDDASISEKEEDLMIQCFEKLEARLFKFAIIGDYDKKYLEIYQNILSESNFILLDNSSKLVYDQSDIPINFVGLTNTNDIQSLYDNSYFTITLVHQPDLIKNISKSNIILAGHSLGGQIRLPFIGGIIKRSGADTYINDYYLIDQKQLYISNGIGTQDFSFRLFNKPSISLYRLYNY